MGDMTRNFSRSEFACKCGCGSGQINPVLVDKLQKVRDMMVLLFIEEGATEEEANRMAAIGITSGTRCKIHNANVGGSATSSHLVVDHMGVSHAADLVVPNTVWMWGFLYCAPQVFRRGGVGQTDEGQRVAHVDVDPNKPTPRWWLY